MKLAEKCIICGKNSAVFQKESGNSLCKSCFVEYVEKKINKSISKNKLTSNDDKICIGVSGGKDSLVLLYNLYQRYKRLKISNKLSIVFIDEGIREYRDESIKNIEEFIKKFEIDVNFTELKFKDEFGFTMDEINSLILKNKFKMNACTVCGTVRRRLLNKGAKITNSTKLAIGHNLDDTVQTFLLNILRNDLDKIQIMEIYGSAGEENELPDYPFIPRIKPLAQLTEKEISLYCYYKDFPIQSSPCPFSRSFPILRRKVQEFINNVDERSSEIKFNLLKINQEIIQKLKQIQSPKIALNKCKLCNHPTGTKRDICLYCELKNKFISVNL